MSIYMSKFCMSVVLREQRQRMLQKKTTGMLWSMGPFNRFISWIIPEVKQKNSQQLWKQKNQKKNLSYFFLDLVKLFYEEMKTF